MDVGLIASLEFCTTTYLALRLAALKARPSNATLSCATVRPPKTSAQAQHRYGTALPGGTCMVRQGLPAILVHAEHRKVGMVFAVGLYASLLGA